MANHKAETYTKKQIEQAIEAGILGPLLMYGNIQSRELAAKMLAERLKEVQPAQDDLTPDLLRKIADAWEKDLKWNAELDTQLACAKADCEDYQNKIAELEAQPAALPKEEGRSQESAEILREWMVKWCAADDENKSLK